MKRCPRCGSESYLEINQSQYSARDACIKCGFEKLTSEKLGIVVEKVMLK